MKSIQVRFLLVVVAALLSAVACNATKPGLSVAKAKPDDASEEQQRLHKMELVRILDLLDLDGNPLATPAQLEKEPEDIAGDVFQPVCFQEAVAGRCSGTTTQ